MSNIVKQEGIINFPDRSTKPSYAIAQYGILKHVVLSQYITQALISIGYLTKELKLNAFYSYNKAYIIQRKAPNKYRTIATATLQSDGLFHVDDMTKFLEPLNIKPGKDECYTLPIDAFTHLTITETPYTVREIKYRVAPRCSLSHHGNTSLYCNGYTSDSGMPAKPSSDGS